MADHIDFIFRADRENPPAERSLPWEETRDGITVVVEPKPHWADDLCGSFASMPANIATIPTGGGAVRAPGSMAISIPVAMTCC
ncbi:hypothetical protein [Ochrobactrum teleogrylli]